MLQTVTVKGRTAPYSQLPGNSQGKMRENLITSYWSAIRWGNWGPDREGVGRWTDEKGGIFLHHHLLASWVLLRVKQILSPGGSPNSEPIRKLLDGGGNDEKV